MSLGWGLEDECVNNHRCHTLMLSAKEFHCDRVKNKASMREKSVKVFLTPSILTYLLLHPIR